MDAITSSSAVQSARFLYQGLSAKVRRRGSELESQGAVYDVDVESDTSSVHAMVSDDKDLEVQLEFNQRTQLWRFRCDGPNCRSARCVHVAAVLCHYLVHIAPDPSDDAPAPGDPSKPEVTQDGTLRSAAVAHVGRRLNPEEQRFVDAVGVIYRQCNADGQVPESVLWTLGWPGRIPSYSAVEVLPGRPATELEFWFGLTELAKDRGYRIPAGLQSLKPSPELHEQLQRIHRQREVQTWMATLRGLPSAEPPERTPVAVELRFRLGGRELTPEARSGDDPWRPLKVSGLSSFNQNVAPRLEHQAAALWASYYTLVTFHGTDFGEPNSRMSSWLGLQLRVPALSGYFVDAAGLPLVRHESPLRWRVTEPAAPEGDYEFSLVDSQDHLAATILARFNGRPPLYLTEAGLYPGPELVPSAILPTQSTRIPAAALETNIGLRLLEWTHVTPPPRLSEKIQTLPLHARVQAELTRGGTHATEYCRLRIAAATPSGRFPQTLMESGWVETPGPRRDSEGLIRLDRSSLSGIPESVHEAGFQLDPHARTFSLRVTKAFPALFLKFLAGLPPSAEVILAGELASLRDGAVSGTLRLDAEDAGPDWFDLKVVVNVDDTTLTPEEIKLLVDARGQWVRLGSRGWRRLDYQLTDQEESDLARIGLTPRQLSAEPQRLHALQLADPAARRFLERDTAEAIERKAAELRARVTPPQPGSIRAELRPYQLEGFHFLAYLTANRFGGVLADDMGLGKTLQTLTWLAWLRADGADASRRVLPSLVVCPKSVQDNWRAEAERFYPDLRVTVWTGVAAEDLNTALAAADLHVLNYAQLRTASEILARTDFLAVILDEGQNIKNPSSQTAQVARQLRADYRLVLTGTPIENRLLDLWSLLAFAMPGILGSRTGFNRLYDSKDDPFARPRLAARVRPFLLRRTKSQVARDLPDRVEEDLYCELEGEQRALYRAELKTAQRHLLKLKTQSALNKDRFHLLTSLLRLRQICCHPRLLKPDATQDGAKMDALLETLEPLMEEGEKVLVFSQFVELLSLLKAALESRGWTHWYLAGETENRGELVQRFQGHEGGGVFLISLKAGGAGLNLTAASYVILFDPWWNPAVENQAIDRTHRIGQTRKIMAYRLLIKDSIEEKIRSLQKSKHLLAEEVLGEERFSSALTLDDLRFLLAD